MKHLLLVCIFALLSGVSALCPGNGNTAVVYVTVNGGGSSTWGSETKSDLSKEIKEDLKDEKKHHAQKEVHRDAKAELLEQNSVVFGYDSAGHFLGPVLNMSSFREAAPYVLDEKGEKHLLRIRKARGIIIGPQETLWIASSEGVDSAIHVFAPTLPNKFYHDAELLSKDQTKKDTFVQQQLANFDCTRNYERLFTARSKSKNPLLKHPYDMAFDADSARLYVSNQNSISVTRYDVRTGAPLRPVHPGIQQKPGAFITQKNERGYQILSARGILLTERAAGKAGELEGIVVLADVANSELNVFRQSDGGHLWGYDSRIVAPIQVVADLRASRVPKWFYVTTKAEGVGVYKVEASPGGLVVPLIKGKFGATSGVTLYGTNQLVVADRLSRKIYVFRNDGLLLNQFTPQGEKIFAAPEFLLATNVLRTKDAEILPTCYSLKGTGLEYSVLCLGLWWWGFLLFLGVPLLLYFRRQARQWIA